MALKPLKLEYVATEGLSNDPFANTGTVSVGDADPSSDSIH